MFLSVILDGTVSGKSHIANVARKISKSIGINYKASHTLSLHTLYYSNNNNNNNNNSNNQLYLGRVTRDSKN